MEEPKDIFDETSCLTEQQLQQYLQGRLGREEAYKVERHVASCAFCSEALEGLSTMEKPEELPLRMAAMKKRFRRQLRRHKGGRRSMKDYVWLTVIVFVIIALLLLAYYAMQWTIKGKRPVAPPAQEQPAAVDPPAI